MHGFKPGLWVWTIQVQSVRVMHPEQQQMGIGQEVEWPEGDMVDSECSLVGDSMEELSEALTLAMGEEVVSERGGGAGVIISGAHTVTAEGGAELLHACQSLCRAKGSQTTGTEPTGSRRQVWMSQAGEEVEGKRNIYRDQMSRRGK